MYPIFFWWSNRAIDSIQLLLSYAVGLWFRGTNIRFSKLNRETSKNVCSQTLSLEALSTMTHFVTKSNTLLLWHCTKVRPHGRSKSSWLWLEFLVPIRRSSSWEMRLNHIVAINLCSSPNLYGTIWNHMEQSWVLTSTHPQLHLRREMLWQHERRSFQRPEEPLGVSESSTWTEDVYALWAVSHLPQDGAPIFHHGTLLCL